jgi:hypothetical protein
MRPRETFSRSTMAPTAFMQRMRGLGWIDGRTIAIEYRWAEGSNERFAEIAVEFGPQSSAREVAPKLGGHYGQRGLPGRRA